MCWKGANTAEIGSSERERERKNVCEFVYVRSNLEFSFGTTGRDLKGREVK